MSPKKRFLMMSILPGFIPKFKRNEKKMEKLLIICQRSTRNINTVTNTIVKSRRAARILS